MTRFDRLGLLSPPPTPLVGIFSSIFVAREEASSILLR